MDWNFNDLNDATHNLHYKMSEPGIIKLTQCLGCFVYFEPYYDRDHPTIGKQIKYCQECNKRRWEE